MLLTDKYADKIYGTLTCYDRMIIQGYIPGWSHADGMTSYLNANGIRIFDYSSFLSPLLNKFVKTLNALLMKMASKLNSSANSGLSVRMTVSSRSSQIPVRQKGWFTFFLPWNNAILINHGMIKQPERHS